MYKLFLVLIISFSFSAFSQGPTQKPFKRAIILSGSGLNVPLLLGFLDGTIAANRTPDVIIGTCGGSLVAALANVMPDPRSRYEYVRSREFYDLMRTLILRDITLVDFMDQREILLRAATINMNPNSKVRMIPSSLFNYSILHVTDELERTLISKRFSTPGFRSIVLAGRMNVAPHEAGYSLPRDRKLFTETYFTDPDTARYITNVKSFVGWNFPDSSVSADTAVVSHVSLSRAVRASISEPLLISPAFVDGYYYMGGAMDLNPIYLARALASEVIAQTPTEFDDFVAVPAMQGTFGFNPNQLSARVTAQGFDYTMNVPAGSYVSLSPTGRLNLPGVVENFNIARIAKLSTGVPETYEEYVRIFDDQYSKAYYGAMNAAKR